MPPLLIQAEESDSDSNEPLIKRAKKSAKPVIEEVEPTIEEQVVIREDAPSAQQLVVLPIVIPTDSNNPTLTIMNVVATLMKKKSMLQTKLLMKLVSKP